MTRETQAEARKERESPGPRPADSNTSNPTHPCCSPSTPLIDISPSPAPPSAPEQRAHNDGGGPSDATILVLGGDGEGGAGRGAEGPGAGASWVFRDCQILCERGRAAVVAMGAGSGRGQNGVYLHMGGCVIGGVAALGGGKEGTDGEEGEERKEGWRQRGSGGPMFAVSLLGAAEVASVSQCV
jgi:hypothetical protein